jgi:hypothetical protein
MKNRHLCLITTLSRVLILFAGSAALISCGNTMFSSAPDNKKETPKQASSDDDKASDPQVVAGSYLTCEITTSDKKKSSTDDAVGCNVIYNDKIVAPDKNMTVVFSSTSSSQVSPTSASPASASPQPTTGVGTSTSASTATAGSQPDIINLSGKPQALFFSSPAQTSVKTFHARLVSHDQVLNEFVCEGAKLPCVKPLPGLLGGRLTFATLGLWAPKALADASISKNMLKPDCPVLPDKFCTPGPSLSTANPGDNATDKACLTTSQSILTTFNKILTNKSDPLKIATAPPTLQSTGSIDPSRQCVVKKVSSSGATPKTINHGSAYGCSVVMVKDKANSTADILILTTSSIHAGFEDQLNAIACP